MKLNEEELQNLIEGIKKERDVFIEKGSSTKKHDEVLLYLKTDNVPLKYHNNELLYAAIHDLDTLYADYVLNSIYK